MTIDHREPPWAGAATQRALDLAHRIVRDLGLLILTIVSLVMSGRIVYRTVGMALSARFHAPYSDQWDLIPAVTTVLDGAGSLSLFWAQHNEHRMALFLLLDVIDARFFHGTGGFLLAVNWLMATATAVLLSVLAWHVPSLRGRHRILAFAVIVGCVFSSCQMENLALPIGNSNLGTYLFGAATFAGIAYAAQRGGSAWRWLAPASAGFLATVSLASGLIVWPLAWVMALALGVTWRGLAGWAALSTLVIAAYLHDFTSGDPGQHAGQMSALIDFLLLYFGGPLGAMGPVKSAVAGAVALLLFAAATYLLATRDFRRHWALVALVTTGIFILGTGMMTAIGRVALGVATAQASRYTSPVLILWAVALLMLLAVPIAGTVRLMPLRVLQVAFPVFALFCLMRIEPFGEWIIGTAFQVRQTGIAVALGIDDPANIFTAGVTRERMAIYQPMLARYHLAMFDDARRLGLGKPLDARYKVVPGRDCLGAVEGAAPVKAPSDAAWIHGWVWDPVRRQVPRYVLFTDSTGTIVGWAETGAARSDAEAMFPQIKRSDPGFGGYATMAPGGRVLSFGLDEQAGSVCQIPAYVPGWPIGPLPLWPTASAG